jgi:hypothetical protein
MTGIFLGEHTIFLFVSGLPKEGYSRNIVPLHLHYNLFKFRCDKFIVKGILFEEQTAFCLYRSLYKRDIPETYYSLSSNVLQPVQVSLVAVYREWHFTGRTQQLFLCIAASITGIFLKHHTIHCLLHMRYNLCKFCYFQSIGKGILLGQSSFSMVLRLLQEGYSCNVILFTVYACATTSVSFVAISEGLFHGEQWSFSSVLWLV